MKLDALRAFTRASYHSIKSYFTKMRIGHNKSKLTNQDILAQEFRLDIYNSSCFVEYPGLFILSQVLSLNHFGSRMKHSCLRIDGEVVCKITRSQRFFLIFLRFAKRRTQVALRGSLVALSCGEKSRKTSGTRVFAKNLRGLFITYGDYFVHASRNCTKFVCLSWRSE